jgi:hypothetical protein
MSNENHIEKKYKLSKKFFGRFPTHQWDEMIVDIASDPEHSEINAKIINCLNQLKSVFYGKKNYLIKIFKTYTDPLFNAASHHMSFNIEVLMETQRIIELDYFPLRSDGLPSIHPYYNFWIDPALMNTKLLVKDLYKLNDDYSIQFRNSIFFNSGFNVNESSERITVNIKTRIKANGKLKSILDVPYDFELLCEHIIHEPKRVAHALYFSNNEVTYEDFIKNEKDAHLLNEMINI